MLTQNFAAGKFYRWYSVRLEFIPSIQATSQLGRTAAPIRGKVSSQEGNLGWTGPLEVLCSAPTQSRSSVGELAQGQPSSQCLQDGSFYRFSGQPVSTSD